MSGPWEEYQSKPALTPWEEYAQASEERTPKRSVKPISKTERFTQGLIDPISGGAQLLTNILPKGVADAGNRFNNWLAEKTGLVSALPEGGVDQQVREQESEYQARRAASGEKGVDWMRMFGNIASPANLALASRVPAAASTLGRVATGAGVGAVSAGMAPVTNGDFWQGKTNQLAVGGVTGGAVPIVTSGVSRLISPRASINPQVAALRAEGARPTVGQTLGGAANTAEEKLMSVPVVGDAIANARRAAAQDLNTAAFNRALDPVGLRLPNGLSGREAVQYVDDALSQGYNRLLPQMSVRADNVFNTELSSLRQMVSTGAMDPRSTRAFERILTNDVLSKFRGQQALTGETLKRIESDLGQQISRLGASTDADQRLVGNALQEVQAQLRQLAERSNPQLAPQLRALNTAWANFKRVQRAAGGVGAEDGMFSPAQLQSAVRALDRSKDKARFAEGNALMQDLSDAGKSVLGNKVPDSGTAGRMLPWGLASFLDPTLTVPIALGTGAATYSRPAQNALTYMLTQRPQAAQPIANALTQAYPMLVPLGSQVGLQTLD